MLDKIDLFFSLNQEIKMGELIRAINLLVLSFAIINAKTFNFVLYGILSYKYNYKKQDYELRELVKFISMTFMVFIVFYTTNPEYMILDDPTFNDSFILGYSGVSFEFFIINIIDYYLSRKREGYNSLNETTRINNEMFDV
jgi:hypothetical protein